MLGCDSEQRTRPSLNVDSSHAEHSAVPLVPVHHGSSTGHV